MYLNHHSIIGNSRKTYGRGGWIWSLIGSFNNNRFFDVICSCLGSLLLGIYAISYKSMGVTMYSHRCFRLKVVCCFLHSLFTVGREFGKVPLVSHSSARVSWILQEERIKCNQYERSDIPKIFSLWKGFFMKNIMIDLQWKVASQSFSVLHLCFPLSNQNSLRKNCVCKKVYPL